VLRFELGMSHQVSEQLRLRADWDLLLNVGDEDETGEADINVFSVGPEFRF
jgi:OOP family OmpA-OmpF porin